ncbi:MAG: hypothetical protein FGM45_06475 [Actinobacteria bacterium]|nr:hypothetical protein [Actinomycetota bacterium]
MAQGDYRAALSSAWSAFRDAHGDTRRIVAVHDTSPRVSTNTVYRVSFDDGTNVYGKVSSYGSYFLFAEDHDRLYRCTDLLADGPYRDFLARVLGGPTPRGDRPFTWYDENVWVAFYEEAQKAESLPRQLNLGEITCLAENMARFHAECRRIAPHIPATSNSIKSDAIHLLDLLSSPFAPRNFDLPPEHIGVLWRHTHDFLMALEEVRYDSWSRIPILVDWNLGNFSVKHRDGGFDLFSRWDYDWFRVESRLLDFYFLSRVSSATGDRTHWTYSPHTLVEPHFVEFVRAYHRVDPLSPDEIRFLPEAYRFFILNYVVREGARFFRPDLCTKFRSDAARVYLPAIDRLDISPLLRAIGA